MKGGGGRLQSSTSKMRGGADEWTTHRNTKERESVIYHTRSEWSTTCAHTSNILCGVICHVLFGTAKIKSDNDFRCTFHAALRSHRRTSTGEVSLLLRSHVALFLKTWSNKFMHIRLGYAPWVPVVNHKNCHETRIGACSSGKHALQHARREFAVSRGKLSLFF